MDDLLYYKDNCQFLEYTNNSSERLSNIYSYIVLYKIIRISVFRNCN